MPVVPRDPQFPTHTIPAYQTPTVDIMEVLDFHNIPFLTGEANIKIYDFGRGMKQTPIFSLWRSTC